MAFRKKSLNKRKTLKGGNNYEHLRNKVVNTFLDAFYTFSHFKRPFLYNENCIIINYRIIYDLFFLWSKNINF